MVEFEKVMFSKPPAEAVPILKPFVLLVMMQLVTAIFSLKAAACHHTDSHFSSRLHVACVDETVRDGHLLASGHVDAVGIGPIAGFLIVIPWMNT